MDPPAAESAKPSPEATTSHPSAPAPSSPHKSEHHQAAPAPTPAPAVVDNGEKSDPSAKLTRDQLYPKVKGVIKSVDVDTVTVKMVAQQLKEKNGYDFDVAENKALLKQVISDIFAEDDDPVDAPSEPHSKPNKSSKRKKTEEEEVDKSGEEDGSAEDDDSSHDDNNNGSSANKKKRPPPKKSSASSSRRSSDSGPTPKKHKWGETATTLRSGDVLRVDEALQKIIFIDSDTRMNVLKLVQQYARANNLSERGRIKCDDNMKACFGEETMTDNALNKKIDEHLLLPNGTTLSEARNKKKGKKKKKEPLKEGEEPRPKKNTGFNKMKVLSPALAEVLGKQEMSRGDVVKALHDYFKAHDLQDKTNRANINFDEKLQAVFKCKKTTFFKLNKLLVKHLANPDDLA